MVDFQPGEKLVIPGSEAVEGTDFPVFQWEEVVVDWNEDGHVIHLTAPLAYTHRSEILKIEGRVVDLRCEVGLLSRNVIIQGDNVTSVGQMYGVHTIAMHSGMDRRIHAVVSLRIN